MQGPLTFRHASQEGRRRRCNPAARNQTARIHGQSAVEYLVVVSVLLGGIWGAGLFGEQVGLLALLLDALRGFHHRFTTTLSLPL
jgi:hypothetical protein